MIEALEERRLLAFVPPGDPRVVTNLDTGWKFLRADSTNAQAVAFNDSSWSNVNVPHTWNNVDGQDGGNDYYRGIGWYRTHITPAAGLVGKSLYLKFDGANLTTDLYVNGVVVGEHKGGYSAFGWDISSYLVVGADNVIAVKVTNAADNNVPPLAGDYTMFGGIYRHVNLIATSPQHVALAEFVPPDPSGVGPSVGYWLNTPGVYLQPTNVTSASANLTITTDALVMYTYGGDANLDGKINVDDYGKIDFNVGLGVAGWANGDFNYDGKINVDDYGIIDFNVGIQGAPFPTAPLATPGVAEPSGVTAVPEPASLGLLAAGAVGLLPRRRRRAPNVLPNRL